MASYSETHRKTMALTLGFIKSGALTVDKSLCKLDIKYAQKELLSQGKHGDKETEYLTAKSCSKFKLSPLNSSAPNTLYYSNKSIADTQLFTSKHGNGFAAYAISPLGELYIHEHISGLNYLPGKHDKLFFHSSFFSGKPGVCFGMIKIVEGRITYIDNRSGHYKPSEENLMKALLILSNYFSEEATYLCQEDDDETNMMKSMFCEEDDLCLVSEALITSRITI